MSSSISYSSDQLAQMESLREYITEYCNANGIDPDVYTAALDDGSTVDLSDDPAFQAYWQLAYLQLVYIMSGGAPEVSGSGEVIYDESAMMEAYNSADAELLALCETLLQDDPELMAFFTTQTEGVDSGNSMLAAISSAETAAATTTDSSSTSSEEEAAYVAEDARAFAEAYGSGAGLDWIISYEEGVRSAEQSILNYIADMDQQIAELTEALNNGTMSAEEYESQMDSISIYRETMLAMLSQLENSLSTVMEMYSKLVEQATEMSMAVINNMRPV